MPATLLPASFRLTLTPPLSITGEAGGNRPLPTEPPWPVGRGLFSSRFTPSPGLRYGRQLNVVAELPKVNLNLLDVANLVERHDRPSPTEPE